MDFPANSLPSLYSSEELLALVVRQELGQIARLGFRLAVVITGHGATNQIAVLERLAAEFNGRGIIRTIVALPFVTNDQAIMEVGHASRIETAIMQSLHPETVRLENLPPLPAALKNADWAVIDFDTFLGNPTPDRTIHAHDDPRLATAEQGRLTIENAVNQITAQVRQELNKIS
jgi:creatinine amidohydrolase/Fe(II)-dependent formamide hydrolase-like protein